MAIAAGQTANIAVLLNKPQSDCWDKSQHVVMDYHGYKKPAGFSLGFAGVGVQI